MVVFEHKPDASGFSREWFSLSDITHVGLIHLERSRDMGPPHFGGTADAKEHSAFKVVVQGIAGPGFEATLGGQNSTGISMAS